MRPIIVGEAPARTGDGRPFTGSAGRRLQELLGVRSYDELVRVVDLANVYGKPMEKVTGQKGSTFKVNEETRFIAAQILVHQHSIGRKDVFLAGKRVAKAFRLDDFEYWEHHNYVANGRVMRVYVIPHPSGVNRYWNDPQGVKYASAFLKSIAYRSLH